MRIHWPPRTLWLPALAVLLPCAFIGVLGYQWLGLEREAETHRGADAARAVAVALRQDLTNEFAAIGDAATRALAEAPISRPPFQPPPSLPTIVSSAFLFESSGTLAAPNDDAGYRRAVEAYGAASSDPVWQRRFATMQDLERSGQITPALAAAKDLLTRSPAPSTEAAVLLALGRLSLVGGQLDAADQYARRIGECCPGARDEFGLSFVLYAASLRATISQRRSTGVMTTAQLVPELRDLVDRGYLGHATDVTDIAILATKAGDTPEFRELVAAIARAHAAIDRRMDTAHVVTRWVSSADPPASDTEARLQFGTLRTGSSATTAVLSRRHDGRLLVMLVEPEALAAWIARWSAGHDAFDVTLRSAASVAAGEATIEALFPQAPALTLALRQRATDSAGDPRRRRLFITAAVAVLVLTLLIGFLAVRDVTRELRTASLRSTFVAGVTHELKTPLASIRLLAETLRWGRARPEVAPELLETIVEETERLSRVVDNVLSSSRIESGTRVYDRHVLSLTDAVRSAVHRFNYVLKQEGFDVVETMDPVNVWVNADQDALGQAVLNLLGNAVKYSGPSRRIHVGVSSGHGEAEIRVADEGIGIAPSEQARIFESFYRAPEVAAQTTGAGLGLSLVRHFAEAHGGRVTVNSQQGRGSVFSVWLPVAKPEDVGPGAGLPNARG